ncbi:MAG: DUF3494 domain-containing protein [Acholeplasmatales bacterium]|nr:MAG: DUF3494 domain-containing protein [Acholeplasmatales bacterium]
MNIIARPIYRKVWLLAALLIGTLAIAACDSSTDPSDEVIHVTAITVTTEGNIDTITEFEGSLQMLATVLPADATDEAVVWSVINETGLATISSSGLLTAEANGTVTVKAVSVSTEAIHGTKVITLSNQIEANMDAKLTDIQVDGQSVLDFNPHVLNYVHVVSDGLAQTPTVTATKFADTATVVIEDAIDVTSSDELDRTTRIIVTTVNLEETIYQVIFESQIAPVDLKSAGEFVILAQTGISTSPLSSVVGDIGVSPSAATYLTGFSLTMDSSGAFSNSDQVVGKVYASDYTSPTPIRLTTAIADMTLAYADAAGRDAHYTELYSGDLSGKTLTAGVFKFGNSVLINTELTLSGSATDVWIFQISGNLTMAANVNIILAGGADAKNIIWQVADTVSIGSGAHFEGTILAKTNISMETNASINGRLYAQTAVTLDETTVTKSND